MSEDEKSGKEVRIQDSKSIPLRSGKTPMRDVVKPSPPPPPPPKKK